MKRYSAFALRGFDSARILQRRFFAGLNLPNASDEQIIESLKPVKTDSVDDMEQRLRKIKSTHQLLLRYRQLMNNHIRRCDKFNKAKSKKLGVKMFDRADRQIHRALSRHRKNDTKTLPTRLCRTNKAGTA